MEVGDGMKIAESCNIEAVDGRKKGTKEFRLLINVDIVTHPPHLRLNITISEAMGCISK